MKKRTAFLIYSFLVLILIGAAVLLGFQVKHYLYERTDPLADVRTKEIDEVDIRQELEQNEVNERRQTLLVFNNTDSFEALATPVPRPTATPLPPPSPTPITPGKNWKINFATRSMVSLKKYDGSDVVAKIGDEVPDEVFGRFRVDAVEGGFNDQRVKVVHVESGTIGWITERAK